LDGARRIKRDQVGDFDQMVAVGLRRLAFASLRCVLSCGEVGCFHDRNDIVHSDLPIDENVGVSYGGNWVTGVRKAA
jgi:hypothetical protein